MLVSLWVFLLFVFFSCCYFHSFNWFELVFSAQFSECWWWFLRWYSMNIMMIPLRNWTLHLNDFVFLTFLPSSSSSFLPSSFSSSFSSSSFILRWSWCWSSCYNTYKWYFQRLGNLFWPFPLNFFFIIPTNWPPASPLSLHDIIIIWSVVSAR